MNIPTEIEIQVSKQQKINLDNWIFIEASKLNLDEEFMQYEPKTANEKTLKRFLSEGIQNGLKDFYCAKYNPSLNEEGTGICYEPGKFPAVGFSYEDWEKLAKEFYPERNSRLGNKYEYSAFMAEIIKLLIADNWTVEEAWNEVCNDSIKLGHYYNCEDAKNDFEETGSREVCGFCDLANTYKILAKDANKYGEWIASGCYWFHSFNCPVGKIYYFAISVKKFEDGSGFIIFD